jgi:hypothetical protein
MSGPPSKVGLAREYALLLEQTELDGLRGQWWRRVQKLLGIVDSVLKLPSVGKIDQEIVKQSTT